MDQPLLAFLMQSRIVALRRLPEFLLNRSLKQDAVPTILAETGPVMTEQGDE
jgi:hypothetical protein